MSDLIDRQTLLRQINIDSEGEPGYYGDTWKFIDTIKKMPSALGTNLAEVGTDLISRQAAIDALCRVDEYNGRSIEAIRQLPSAQPELIEKTAYIRGFEQGRTQGMIDAQGGKK